MVSSNCDSPEGRFTCMQPKPAQWLANKQKPERLWCHTSCPLNAGLHIHLQITELSCSAQMQNLA